MDTFYVWTLDDIDSSDFEDTDEPRPLFVALLCRDAEEGEHVDVLRGYDPRDGIFERPGVVLSSLGGIDLPIGPHGRASYKRVIESELAAELEAERESVLVRGDN